MRAETQQRENSRTASDGRGQTGRELSLFLIGLFGVWTFRATWFSTVDESIASPVWRAAYSEALKFFLWVLPAAAFAWWLRGGSPLRYLGLSVLPSRREGLVCFIVMDLFLSLVAFLEVSMNNKCFTTDRLWTMSPTLALLQFVISPLFEEILFRGLVMKELMTLLPTFLANVLTSALFAGIHLPYWLAHGGLTHAVIANSAGIFLFSVVACWMFSKTGSIWPPTLAHIANNVLPAVLVVSRL